ncbi:hypothetical protein E4U43_008382 [Claviceps pusilla]|uniref:Uncharacterized protein n=1 Tax=Claviceps pusilla TaxID=123648 RepID=A0A9P7NH57_9HYPO|nr:hypothetical protein E4U43_008382 [Claviceps pusilla]
MRLEVLRTNMLSVALKIVEFHKPDGPTSSLIAQRSGAEVPRHDLSDVAYKATKIAKISPNSAYAQLEPLLNGLAKLLLVGGRIEGKVFDQSGLNWVGSINGGMDGLRSQLVCLLQGAGLDLATSLERGGRSLWLALEGRKFQLDSQNKQD